MSWNYLQAFNPEADPFYSCHYGIKSNPNYQDCARCSQRRECRKAQLLSVTGQIALDEELTAKYLRDFLKE